MVVAVLRRDGSDEGFLSSGGEEWAVCSAHTHRAFDKDCISGLAITNAGRGEELMMTRKFPW